MFEVTMRRSSKKNIEAIIVSQNEQTLRFNGKATVRLEKMEKTSTQENNLFDCFNDYIEATFTQENKVALFNLFKKAHTISESPKKEDYRDILDRVTPIVDDILHLINVDKYCGYINFSKYMVIPPDLTAATAKGDYPEQTTITADDYTHQVCLAFVTRAVYPIIFSLISRFEREMGYGHSERVCGDLIRTNRYITNLRGWHKLKNYIEFAFHKRGTTDQVDSVNSSEYFVDKVFYGTLFNRLCCALIPETEEGKHLATVINASARHYEQSGPRLIKKDFSGNDDEDKRSMYERNHAAEQVKSSDETANAEYFSFGLFDDKDEPRYKDRFKYQCMGLGIKQVELVEAVYDRLPPNWHFELGNHTLKLLQLTYQEDFPPLGFWACDYTQLMAALVLAQVKLSERGFKYLPSILGAIHDPNGMRGLSDGLKLNSTDKDYLSSICDIQSLNNDDRSANEAVVEASNFLSKLGNGMWMSNLEYGVLDDPEVYARVKKADLFQIELDIEIKNEFMELIRQNNA